MQTQLDKLLSFPNGNSGEAGTVKSSPEDVTTRVAAIKAAFERSTQNIVETARLVAEARNALDNAGFRTLAKLVGLSHGTLCKLVTIHSRKERFSGREASLPLKWTVLYSLATLDDGAFETFVASEKLRPELTEKEVKKFVAQRAAAADVTMSASKELAFISVTIKFPALLSLQDEDRLRQKAYDAIESLNLPDVAVRVSDRKKVRKRR